MSESTKLERGSDTASTTSLKEEERIVRKEGEVAAAGGDIEEAMDEKASEEGDGEVDPYLVNWKGSDDPENPLNFATRKKISLMVMIAAIAFLTYLPPLVSLL